MEFSDRQKRRRQEVRKRESNAPYPAQFGRLVDRQDRVPSLALVVRTTIHAHHLAKCRQRVEPIADRENRASVRAYACGTLMTFSVSHDLMILSITNCTLRASSAFASTLLGGVFLRRSSTQAAIRVGNVSEKPIMPPG
jgi:hypothetical protein